MVRSGSASDARFLATAGKAADADKLDGLDGTAFLAAGAKAADTDLLDGVDSTGFLRGSGAPTISSYRRDWADNGLVHRVHDLSGIGTIDFTCADPAAGSLTFTNTSAITVESIIEVASNAGAVTLTQVTTAPAASHTAALTSPGRVVWQFAPSTFFDPGHLATVTTSQIAMPPIQCRIYSQALTQDPVRG